MESRGPGAPDAKTRPRTRNVPPPEEYSNPAGVGGDDCLIEDLDEQPCDPAGAEDLAMEESKPGYGIAGYEGEEVGGG